MVYGRIEIDRLLDLPDGKSIAMPTQSTRIEYD